MKRLLISSLFICIVQVINAQTFYIQTEKNAADRELYAAEYLKKKLSGLGYAVNKESRKADCRKTEKGRL